MRSTRTNNATGHASADSSAAADLGHCRLVRGAIVDMFVQRRRRPGQPITWLRPTRTLNVRPPSDIGCKLCGFRRSNGN